MIFTKDNALHAFGGIIFVSIMAPLLWIPWTILISGPVSLLAYGYIREVAQAENDWLSPLRNPHKFFEALSWGAGAIPASIMFFFFKVGF